MNAVPWAEGFVVLSEWAESERVGFEYMRGLDATDPLLLTPPRFPV